MPLRPPGSSGTPCRQPRCGAGSRPIGAPKRDGNTRTITAPTRGSPLRHRDPGHTPELADPRQARGDGRWPRLLQGGSLSSLQPGGPRCLGSIEAAIKTSWCARRREHRDGRGLQYLPEPLKAASSSAYSRKGRYIPKLDTHRDIAASAKALPTTKTQVRLGILLVFATPCQHRSLAWQENGRTVRVSRAGARSPWVRRSLVAQPGRSASASSSIFRMFRRSVLNFSSKSG